jgi:hypothetical protein
MTGESSGDGSGIVQKALSFVFIGGILELLGMLLYLSVTSEDALRNLTADGITLEEVTAFLLTSPDRLLVAGVLALFALLLVWKADRGGRTYHTGHGGNGGDF